MKRKLVMVTNMYPSSANPRYGTFVKSIYDCLKKEDSLDLNLIKISHKKSLIHKTFAYIIFYVQILFALLKFSEATFYFHYVSHSTLPLLLVRKRKRTYVLNFHGSDMYQKGFKRKIVARAISKANIIISPSEYYSKELTKNFDIHIPIKIIPTAGVPKQYFQTPGINKLLNYRNNITIGFVGRVSYMKGFDIVLEVYAKSLKLFENCELIVAGNKLSKKEFETYNSQLKQNDIKWIENLGREELHLIYDQIDVLLFPSRYKESLGLVVLEAMSKNCFVLMSKQTAFNEILNGSEAVKQLDNSLAIYIQELERLKVCPYEYLFNSLNSSKLTASSYSEINICKEYLNTFNEKSFLYS